MHGKSILEASNLKSDEGKEAGMPQSKQLEAHPQGLQGP